MPYLISHTALRQMSFKIGLSFRHGLCCHGCWTQSGGSAEHGGRLLPLCPVCGYPVGNNVALYEKGNKHETASHRVSRTFLGEPATATFDTGWLPGCRADRNTPHSSCTGGVCSRCFGGRCHCFGTCCDSGACPGRNTGGRAGCGAGPKSHGGPHARRGSCRTRFATCPKRKGGRNGHGLPQAVGGR